MHAAPDYSVTVPTQLEFDVGITEDCIGVMAVDDSVYEDSESFSISLLPMDRVDITVSSTTVEITDNDGIQLAWNVEYKHSDVNITPCRSDCELESTAAFWK